MFYLLLSLVENCCGGRQAVAVAHRPRQLHPASLHDRVLVDFNATTFVHLKTDARGRCASASLQRMWVLLDLERQNVLQSNGFARVHVKVLADARSGLAGTCQAAGWIAAAAS